jgi:hypothetical protein
MKYFAILLLFSSLFSYAQAYESTHLTDELLSSETLNDLNISPEQEIEISDHPVITVNETYEKVEATSLHLLGRGMINRKTHESLAVACIHECHDIRMVYFTSDGKNAFLIGPTYPLAPQGQEVTSLGIKTQLKNLSKHYRQIQGRQPKVVYGKMFATTGIAIGAMFLAVGGVVTLPVAALGAIGLWIGGVKFTMNSTPVFQYDSASADFSSTEGWNWSSRPKKISDHTFDLLLQSSNEENLVYIRH